MSFKLHTCCVSSYMSVVFELIYHYQIEVTCQVCFKLHARVACQYIAYMLVQTTKFTWHVTWNTTSMPVTIQIDWNQTQTLLLLIIVSTKLDIEYLSNIQHTLMSNMKIALC